MKKEFSDLFEDVTAGVSHLDSGGYQKNGETAIVDQGKELIGGYTDDPNLELCRRFPCVVFGDHTKIFKYLDFPFVLGAQGTRIFVVKEGLDSKYAYFMLKYFKFPEGTGYQRHFKYLARANFEVPSLKEQQRIAMTLSAIEAVHQKNEMIQRLVGELVTALFWEMFGRISERGALGDFLDLIDYGTNQKAEFDSGEVPVLRMNNVLESGELDLSKIKKASFSKEELASNLLRPGDLLVNRTNSRKLVGKVGIWTSQSVAVAASYFIRVRVDSKRFLPKFVHVALNRPEAKQYFRSKAKGAVGQANIGMETIKMYRLPLVPISLQEEFVSKLEQIRALQNKLSERRISFRALEGAVGGRYF